MSPEERLCQQLVGLLHLEAPELVPQEVTLETLTDAVRLLQERHQQAKQAQEEEAWRRWFARLPAERREELAARARQGGLPSPESFEAARGVIFGDFVASLLTPEELATIGHDEGKMLAAADLDRWAETGELPWDVSSS